MPIFKTPFSGAYWRTAALEVKNYRSIVFSALMIAACIVLSHCTIRAGGTETSPTRQVALWRGIIPRHPYCIHCKTGGMERWQCYETLHI